MAIVTINDEHLTNIAGAIREKNGTQDTYKPMDMAAAIAAIQAGGGEVNMVEAAITGKSSSDGMTPFNVRDYVDDTENIVCIFVKLNEEKTNYMTDFCYIKGYGFLAKDESNVEYFGTADMLGSMTNPRFVSYYKATEITSDSHALGITADGKINTFKWTGSKWASPSYTATSTSYMHIWMLYI